jgi:hypothetical protein
MQSEERLELVRTLTRSAMELTSPATAADFDDDFGAWAINTGAVRVAEDATAFAPAAQGLDITLVAGMFFQVLMEASRLPESRPERVSYVRKKAKDYLVTRLAGQITMAQFYRLLNIIEEKVGYYFEHLNDDWTGVKVTAAKPAAAALRPAARVKGEELRQALDKLALPGKGRGKFTGESLWEFLNGNDGGWFRLLDLEAHFQVNKKTAWSYLNLLLTAGVLEHNGEKANRVRYALAGRFRAAETGSTVAA